MLGALGAAAGAAVLFGLTCVSSHTAGALGGKVINTDTPKLNAGALPMRSSVAHVFLSFNGRVRRLTYVPATLSMLMLLLMVELASPGPWYLTVTGWPVVYCLAALASKRLHDLGHSAHCLWLFIAPLIILGAIAYFGALQTPPDKPVVVRTLLIYRGLWISLFQLLVWPFWIAYGLYVMLAKSMDGENRYGPSK